METGYSTLPGSVPPSASIVDSVGNSHEHMKVLALAKYLEDIREGDPNAMNDFFIRCSHYGLSYRLVDNDKTSRNNLNDFEIATWEKIQWILSDLNGLGLIESIEDGGGDLYCVGVNDSGKSLLADDDSINYLLKSARVSLAAAHDREIEEANGF